MSNDERALVERIDQAAMLAQVERWAAVNSGTRNLAGAGQHRKGIGKQCGHVPDAGQIARAAVHRRPALDLRQHRHLIDPLD